MKRLLLIAVMGLVVCRGYVAMAAEHPAAAEPHASTAAPAHGAAAGEHEEHPPLLPSNAEEFKEHTVAPAIWTLIIFLIMLAILYKTAWQQILAGLKKREERIRSDIADAEAARKRAEATLAQYNQQLATAESQVRDILNKAAQDAERMATNMKMQAQKEAEEAKDRATRDIETARKNAVADIYAQAADLSTSIAAKILRRNLNPDDQRQLVEASLQQFQSVGGTKE